MLMVLQQFVWWQVKNMRVIAGVKENLEALKE
jgi:hypothetical protein